MLFRSPEEDHQLHHCCWTGRVDEREEEEGEEEELLGKHLTTKLLIRFFYKLFSIILNV